MPRRLLLLLLLVGCGRLGFDDRRVAGDAGDDAAFDAAPDGTVTAMARQLGLGYMVTCVVDAGDVYCAGYNQYGAVGSGDFANQRTMVKVAGLADVVEIAAGGGAHVCARRANGTVACWGRNHHGQLGDGTLTNRTLPVDVVGLANATAITVGEGHSCALTSTPDVVCWGDNTNGQLGDGSKVDRPAPTSVGLADATEVSAGKQHTCARRASGAVACWGTNQFGQVGDGSSNQDSPIPTPVSGITDAAVVRAGHDHACALRATGQVACWGRDDGGQIDGGVTNGTARVPVTVGGITDAVALSAAGWHSCVTRAAGGFVCWGWNAAGELGNGMTGNATPPTGVTVVPDARRLVAGGEATCAVLGSGVVACWGQNYYGELGDGTTTKSATPRMVLGLP